MKKFLRTRLYRHERMQATRTGVGKLLEDLFEGFMSDLALLPPEHREAAEALEAANGRAGRARAVADYIAGMTDRYAFQEHERIK
jgi:dGTPase